jgi:predicted nucleotidyltransferase
MSGTTGPPTVDELRTKRDAILRAAARHHASNLRVFGSVARGDATARSDVDFVVELPAEYRGFDFFGVLDDLRQELETVLDRRVDVVSIRGPSPDAIAIATAIEREALAL